MSTPKSKGTPKSTGNPFGLTARDVEIAVVAWKCLDADGKINKQKLAKLAHFDKAETADRQWRKVKAKINEAAMPSGSDAGGPDTPAAPATPGDGSAAAVAAADPGSPSLLASKKKKAAGGGKVAGRKRTMKDAKGADDDDDAGVKKEGEGGERPKNGVKRVKAAGNITLKGEPNDDAVQLEAGEV